ncbi:MAG TPA: hypothetical protein VIH40_07970 [Xanthobacteraceae bacterium]
MVRQWIGAVLIGLTLCGSARADDLDDFNAAVEAAAAHNRVALGYLRTDSVDLAVIELERMKEAWAALTGRFGSHRPAVFRDNPLYAETLVDVPVRIVAALLVLDMGRTDLARDSLQAVRRSLSAMRRASGVEVLADCVLDANAAMAAFLALDNSPPDWGNPQTAAEVAGKAAALASVVNRCDRMAPAGVRSEPGFRRLIDGTLHALTFVPRMIEMHDNDLLHRLAGELRAFDHLLVFRYG